MDLLLEEADDELPAELRMDEYDDEDDNGYTPQGAYGNEEQEDELEVMEDGNVALAMMNMDTGSMNDDDEEDEDEEDDVIRPGDRLLVAAITEDEFSHLEVQLLTDDGNLFVHHDIQLPDFPLCLAWLDCPPFLAGSTGADGAQLALGNYMAVGTFSPAIEIWNLDVLDPLEPTATLGGLNPKSGNQNSNSKKSSRKKKSSEIEDEWMSGSHEDSVMTLSWNREYRQALASGSADNTIKIWDVTTQACSHTFTHHSDKVQSVSWHPAEAWLLATGSFDKSVSVMDCRAPSNGPVVTFNSLPSDVENLSWDPHCPSHLYCAMEDGQVSCFDMRGSRGGSPSKALFTFQAHDTTTSSLSFSPRVPGMMATCSVDKTVKVWDCQAIHQASVAADNTSASGSKKAKGSKFPDAPDLVAYKTLNAGKLFSMEFCADEPYLLATAGDEGVCAVWESDEVPTIEGRFQDRVLPEQGHGVHSTVEATIENGSSNSSSSVGVGVGVESTRGFSMTDIISKNSDQDNNEDEGDEWMDEDVSDQVSEVKKKDKKKKKKFLKDKKKM